MKVLPDEFSHDLGKKRSIVYISNDIPTILGYLRCPRIQYIILLNTFIVAGVLMVW